MNREKVIVQFIHGLSSGGAETVVKDYALALKKRGYTVKVLVLHLESNSPNQKQVEAAGISIVPILNTEKEESSFLNRATRKVKREWQIRYFLKAFFETTKPEVVHVHLSLMHYLWYARKELQDVRIIYTCHSTPEAIFCAKDAESMRNKVALKKFLSKENTTVVALHDEMIPLLRELLHTNRVVKLNNPIDLKKFENPSIDRIEFRKHLGIPQDSFVVGHVGRFSQAKNHRFLVQIFAEISKKKENAFLFLVGSGPLKGEIEKQLDDLDLKKKCLILSERGDIPQLDAIMDVFCFPSIYEGLSIATLEAQAAGLKCFVSDGVPEAVICTNHIWRLSLKSSPEVWADSMVKNNMPFQQSRSGLEQFDIERVINDLEKIYFGCEK